MTEIGYTYGYYQHLSPQSIDLCLLYCGYRPVKWRDGFTYCELACGQGVTAAILAALHPEGQFYVMDFNPIHIEYLGHLAVSAGLSNLHYVDASFAEYASDESLPSFDYISAHGIYSWVTVENRRHIRRIIEKKLKVGGVASISYNVLPGWSSMVPFQYFIDNYRRLECTGNLFIKMKRALQFIEEMQSNHALYFANESVKYKLDFIKSQNPSYLVHEYFNADWHPLYSAQVMDEMSECKVRYAGSGNLIENIPACNLSAVAYNHIVSLGDAKMQELAKDFYLNTQFRRDLYIKGGLRIGLAEKKAWLAQVNVMLITNREKVSLEHQRGMVRVNLASRFYEPILDAIESESCDLNLVYERVKSEELTFSVFWECIFTLFGLNYIYPCVAKPKNMVSSKSFNEIVLKRVVSGQEILYLVAPCLYTGVSVSYLELLFLHWEYAGKQRSLHASVMDVMGNVGLSLADDNGNRLGGEEEQVALLDQKYKNFVETRRPFLERVGALEMLKPKKQGQLAPSKRD